MPVVAQIEPTVLCDLNCTFCQSPELRRLRAKPHMSFAEFQRVIEEMGFLVAVGLVGMGEPTLNPEFFKMVRHACDMGIAASTITNCNRHTEVIAQQLVSSGLVHVGTSIDGATATSYETVRRGGDFRRTLSNLGRLVRLRGSARLPRIGVEMIALYHNMNEMRDWVRLCANVGADELTIQARVTNWGKRAYVATTIARSGLAREGFNEALDEARDTADKLGIELSVLRRLHKRGQVCPIPWKTTYVASSGEVVPCCAIADPRAKCMGNVLHQAFEDIWSNQEYVAFRRDITSGAIPDCCLQCYDPGELLEQGKEQPRYGPRQ
jgi:pyrroloquinoline quinone biosynthesis protein E